MLLDGYIFRSGSWEKLTRAEQSRMNQKYQKLALTGDLVKHYHQRKIGEDIVLAFSSNRVLSMCEDVDWAVQYSPGFVRDFGRDNNANPEAFLLIPDLSLCELCDLRSLILCEDVEIYAFFMGRSLYKASVLDNGQLILIPKF